MSRGIAIGTDSDNSTAKGYRRDGFTLVEVLVVMSIISILMGILLPVLGKARYQARMIRGMNNQRQIVGAANLFAIDNDDRYPESIAVVGFADMWNYSDPRKLIGKHARTPQQHRAVSEYLDGYIEDAEIMFCPKAPQKYKYLQESWVAGDKWDNPDTPPRKDPVGGTYCLWWNYVGYLEPGRLFVGPRGLAGGQRESKILVSDYFGYGQVQSTEAFGSCEKFKDTSIAGETWLLSAYFSYNTEIDSDKPDIKLTAGFTDGSVIGFTAAETAAMRVIKNRKGFIPYPNDAGPGIFYLPRNGLR